MRPREFDEDEALDRAMRLFWRHGYEGTSLADLTAAMGINRPSLYAAFGDKEQLFRRALDRYAAGHGCYIQAALAEPTARAVVERLLLGAIELVTDKRNPGGCLAVQGALSCGEGTEMIRRELAARRAAGEEALRVRLQLAKRTGDLPAESNPADLAKYVSTVLQGIAVQSAGGATRKELNRVVELALRAWPA